MEDLSYREALPYRGSFGQARPPELSGLPLPPGPMPAHHRGRPLKAWRYVGVYGPELMLCLGSVRVGLVRQSFWAVWDGERLHERTLVGHRQVRLARRYAGVRSTHVDIVLCLEETPGVETISRSGESYAWTRKQGGVPVNGLVSLDGKTRKFQAHAIIDDSAGYHARHTSWRWWAGVGRGVDGRGLAWNFVEGVHDAPVSSERTLWVDGEPHELSADALAGARFHAEAERVRRDNLLLLRSSYRQPFGRFSGEIAGLTLAEGYGVTESHDAWW